jgi:CRISPR-associated endonuclease/helicase Cas3
MSLEALTDVSLELTGAWLSGTSSSIFPIGRGYSDDHQREMFNAIRDGDHEAIINTNPTGGGKTLSWAAPVIRSQEQSEPLVALATYPTRALVEDQRALLLSYMRQYFNSDEWAPEWTVSESSDGITTVVHSDGTEMSLQDRVQTVTGADLDNPTNTGSAFRTAERSLSEAAKVGLPTIVLTTPDAVTLLATGQYSDSDLGALPALVDLIIVDEFHLTNPRGKRLLPFHLDTYLSLGAGELQQLVFLSATPTADYISRIERAFDTQHVVRDVHDSPPSCGRQILPTTEFGVTNRPLFQTGSWLSSQTEAIAEYVTPPGQTLIVVDSVREVEALAEALNEETEYNIGRVYGWKKQDRAAAIKTSDILVGNTAVEVGVDFDRVNRLIFSAHDPNSALQRLGRMRVQSAFDEYKSVCITTPTVQDSIIENAREGKLSREQLEKIYIDNLPTPGATLPYEDLCAVYARYLWSEASPSLNEMYVPRETKGTYRNLLHTHFGHVVAKLHDQPEEPQVTWETVSDSVYLSQDALMRELHTYRGSSLNCLVIDSVDESEPLKQYNLQHVLKYRKGRLLEVSEIDEQFESALKRPLTASERSYVNRVRPYIECGFLMRGSRENPRDVNAHEFGWAPDHSKLESLDNLRVNVRPNIERQEILQPLSTDVLVYYTPMSARRAREKYSLGTYANVLPYRDGSVFLWNDALLAHTEDLAARIDK